MYMESRKMVLMNLFAGEQWRCKHRKQTGTWRGEEGVEGMEIVAWQHAPYIKQIASENLLHDLAQTSAP